MNSEGEAKSKKRDGAGVRVPRRWKEIVEVDRSTSREYQRSTYLQCPDPQSAAAAIPPPIPMNFPAVFTRRQNVPPFNSVLY